MSVDGTLNQPADFEHSYSELGQSYVVPTSATPVSSPRWIAWNTALAQELQWPQPWSHSDEALAALAGNGQFESSRPGASVYAGHQFGSFNPQLGDGRALLLGEWRNSQGGLCDIQLKGAGPTPYSRGGDGRSPVGPVVREYLMSEAMHALGVPTSRALAAIATGDPVYRQQREPGAVLTRVASSHLRIGTVQFFAMTRRGEGLDELVTYATERHYKAALDIARAQDPKITCAQVLLDEVSKALAALVARWQGIGFIHGVLNTDNMLLCGQTVDYGPCAFMDRFSAGRVFSSIDSGGRYAFGNQPGIVHWNLSVLAQCLLPLIHTDEHTALSLAQGSVDRFPERFSAVYAALLAAKFGLEAMREDDKPLIEQFFQQLEQDDLDFTLAFRWLTEVANETTGASPITELFNPSDGLRDWSDQWSQRRQASSTESAARMQGVNPVVVPRNHLVAQAIDAAENEDYGRLKVLNDRWRSPFTWLAGDLEFAAPPTADEEIHRTFCGT